jgi:hypothetical protein
MTTPINTSRALTVADDSPPTSIVINFTQSGVTVNATLTLTITPAAVGPTPVSVTLNPPAQTIPDNTPAGAPVTSANVVMSDGSVFAGTVTFDPPTAPLVAGPST